MDPADLRADIPAMERVVYLNTGASGPSPRRVVRAAQDFLAEHAYEAPAGDGMYEVGFAAFEHARDRVADLLGAKETEIALTQCTTDGVNRVAGALDWAPGDAVVRTDLEHPAGILPWQRLADRNGVEVRVVETTDGLLDPDDVAEKAEGAKLVCLSGVDWLYGRKQPVEAAVEAAHDAGALVLVDAVQAPGQMPVDVHEWGADFAVGAGHKWLLGPWGGGFLYVREDLAESLVPDHIGYRSVEEPTAEAYEYQAGASRFEVGTTSPAPYVALAEGIDVVQEIGMNVVQDRIEALTDRLKAGVPDDRLVSPRAYESGLVTFTVDDKEATVERLTAEGVRIRAVPMENAVRASLHVFNTDSDVDALLDGLDW